MKLLVVEDDQHIAKNIKKGLEMKSHVVDITFDGAEGYDFALAEEYDVIILDRMLPGMDGLTVCHKLRQENSKTPILMLTAKSLTEDKVNGLDAGADDYLTKPFAFEELIARINALGRRPRETLITDTITVANLTLNPTTYEVKRGDVTVDLSKKEFALLEFFMRHPGTVFTKEQLTEKVWEFDADVLPNTAQVYIGYLRSKVDKNFPDQPELLQTVRGFGYKIEAPK